MVKSKLEFEVKLDEKHILVIHKEFTELFFMSCVISFFVGFLSVNIDLLTGIVLILIYDFILMQFVEINCITIFDLLTSQKAREKARTW